MCSACVCVCPPLLLRVPSRIYGRGRAALSPRSLGQGICVTRRRGAYGTLDAAYSVSCRRLLLLLFYTLHASRHISFFSLFSPLVG